MFEDRKNVSCPVIWKCAKCDREYVSLINSDKKLSKWQRKWSWRKLRFVWVCPICVFDATKF